MADKQDYSGLSSAGDLSKLPIYGAQESQIQDLRDAQQKALDALEQRYAQPNWFKVAAGFAKPQLGGFLASLGSASEALGENVEQQRAQALPIAQMRAQLAQTNLLLGQNKSVSQMLAERRAKNLPITPEFVSEVTARAPESSIAKSLSAEMATQQKQQELTGNQQRLMMDAIQMKMSKGMGLSDPEKQFLDSLGGNLSKLPEAKPLVNEGKPFIQNQTAQPSIDAEQAERARGDVEAISREISRIPDTPENAERLAILRDELKKSQKIAGVTSEESAPPAKEKVGGFYPKTFTPPSVQGLSDDERRATMESWAANARDQEKRSAEQVNQWRSLASDPVYSTLDSQYSSAIDLIKNNPALSKKVFNLLRSDGSLMNQILSTFQAGLGVNLGSMVTNVSIPTETFLRAGLSRDEQLLADRLVSAMLTAGSAKLMSQGLSPEKGQETYNKFLEGTKANLSQNAATALHNLQKDYVTFRQNKRLYDTVMKEHSHQIKSNTVTPFTDVIQNSPDVAKINEESRNQMHKFESDYQKAIEAARKRQGVR